MRCRLPNRGSGLTVFPLVATRIIRSGPWGSNATRGVPLPRLGEEQEHIRSKWEVDVCFRVTSLPCLRKRPYSTRDDPHNRKQHSVFESVPAALRQYGIDPYGVADRDLCIRIGSFFRAF